MLRDLIKLEKTEDKKSSTRKNLPKGKGNLNDGEFLIGNHRGQKEMAKYFSSPERKNLVTQNSLPSEKYPSGIKERSNSQKNKN